MPPSTSQVLELRRFFSFETVAYKQNHLILNWMEPKAVEMEENILAQYVIASMRTETLTDAEGNVCDSRPFIFIEIFNFDLSFKRTL